MKISIEKLREISSYLKESNCSRKAAATKFGVTQASLLYWAEVHHVALPKRLVARELLQRDYTADTIREVQVKDLVKQYGLPNKSINTALQQLSWEVATSTSIRCYTTKDISQTILDDVIANGGNVVQSIKRLQLHANPSTVRRLAEKQGIDLNLYRMQRQRFGLWEILPGKPEQCYVADQRVKAFCHGCGTIHSVLMCNLRSGKSTRCSSCANKARVTQPVTCIETGEIFRSIRQLVNTVPYLPGYHTLRSQLKKGPVSIDQLTYQLVA